MIFIKYYVFERLKNKQSNIFIVYVYDKKKIVSEQKKPTYRLVIKNVTYARS